MTAPSAHLPAWVGGKKKMQQLESWTVNITEHADMTTHRTDRKKINSTMGTIIFKKNHNNQKAWKERNIKSCRIIYNKATLPEFSHKSKCQQKSVSSHSKTLFCFYCLPSRLKAVVLGLNSWSVGFCVGALWPMLVFVFCCKYSEAENMLRINTKRADKYSFK